MAKIQYMFLKKSIFLIFAIGFLFTVFEDSWAQEKLCTWEKNQELTICRFSNPVNLENNLINLEFQAPSNIDDELAIFLTDIHGNMVKSWKIKDWYEILPNKTANISLFAQDFTKINSQFFFDKVIEIHFRPLSDHGYEIEILDFFISEIAEYPNYNIDENLPIQPILPGFIFLIVISFPTGFILVEFSRFFKNQDFFIKLPWILALGFIIYMLFAYAVSTFWISYEVIVSYLIIEFVLLSIYLVRNKKIKEIRFFKTKNSSLFFIILFVMSGFISLTTIGNTGWPIDPNDGLNHGIRVSYAVTNNVRWDGTSLLPILNITSEEVNPYPTGFHNSAAGVSFVLGTFPAVSMAAAFSFLMFLITILLPSFVYRFSNSIFFSSLMFLFSFWRPNTGYWYGDLVWNNWVAGHYSSESGLLVTLVLFMLFIELFGKNKTKIGIITIIGLTYASLITSYYGFLALAILVGLICLISYKSETKRRFILMFSPLIVFLSSVPLWRPYLLEYFGAFAIQLQNPSPHYKLLNLNPFDPSGPIFPFWFSAAFGIISACILIKNKKFRYFSIIYLIISSVGLLSIHPFFYHEVFFYHAGLRSFGLVFFLSIVINLIFIHWLINRKLLVQKLNFFRNLKRSYVIKGIVIVFFVLLLLPSFQRLYDDVNNIHRVVKVPGGNEKNLHLWLYQNTKNDDLVLTDHSWASLWYIGTRGQSLINVNIEYNQVAKTYNPTTEQFEPVSKIHKNMVEANLIFKNPWDYEYISETLKKLDIKYVYLSERTSPKQGGCGFKCYPDSVNWSWKNYDGNARIGMYENHPNLELVLRNGNSAIFKVV